MGMSSKAMHTVTVTECQMTQEQERIMLSVERIDEFIEHYAGSIQNELGGVKLQKLRSASILHSLETTIAACNRLQEAMDGTVKELVHSYMSYCNDSDDLVES